MLHQHRADHDDALIKCPPHAPSLALFHVDQQFVRGQAHAAVLDWPRRRRPAALVQARMPLAALLRVQSDRRMAQFRRIVSLEPLSHYGAEGFVVQCVPVATRRISVGSDFVTVRGQCGRTRQGPRFAPDARSMRFRLAVTGCHHQCAIDVQTDIAFMGQTDRAVQLHRFTRHRQRRGAGAEARATRGAGHRRCTMIGWR